MPEDRPAQMVARLADAVVLKGVSARAPYLTLQTEDMAAVLAAFEKAGRCWCCGEDTAGANRRLCDGCLLP